MSGSNLVVPVVLWGRNAPTHCIATVLLTPDLKNIITGCNDGQICIWDVTDNWEIYPRSMLLGHTSAVTSLALGSCHPEKPYIVSASESGEMCLWDISDGRCIENAKLAITHSNMQAHRFRNSTDFRLVCNGYYPEIHIIDPFSFEIIYSLCSKMAPDWICACCVLKPAKREDDVIVAISNSGTVKVWSLSGSESKSKPVYEDESKQIRCLNAQTLRCCPHNQRTVLIVCSKYWQIYDAGDFTLLCSESNRLGERWAGGDFISIDRVIVWSNEGKGYLYKLPTNANSESNEYHRHGHQPSSPHAYYVLDMYSDRSLACSPAMLFHVNHNKKPSQLLVRGDSEGQVIVWTLPEVTERQMTLVRQESFDKLPVLPPRSSTTLQEVWDSLYQPPAGIIDTFCDVEGRPLQVTSTIYIPSQGRMACGREDGSIVLISASQSIIFQLLENKHISPGKIALKILHGHDGRVTCLLYPFNESTRYEPQYLLSGGADFSVCLWDIYIGTKLHTYTVHGGEITQLLVPPNNCNNRILSCVCSVASDHSVTLLSLKERKCIMMAGRHLFPVQVIKWRPLDDFMVVSCSDGTVYVWQMETGHLDRVIHGMTAEEILNNCDENATPLDTLVNPHITLAQAFKRRNLAAFKNLAQQKLQAPQQIQQQRPPIPGIRADYVKPQAFPMYIQGVRTNTKDPDAHIIFFDTEALIVQLLTEEYAKLSPGELEARGAIPLTPEKSRGLPPEIIDAQAKIAGLVSKVKEMGDTASTKLSPKPETMWHVPPPSPPGRPKQPPARPGHSPPRPSQPPTRPGQTGQTGPLLNTRPAKPPPPIKLDTPYTHPVNMTMEIAQLFMSCLHAWGLDPDLDKLCMNKLGLIKPRCPISFGLITRAGHMSLMLPGWHKRVCKEELAAAVKDKTPYQKVTLVQQARSASFSELKDSKNAGKPVLIKHGSAGVEEGVHSYPEQSSPYGSPMECMHDKFQKETSLQEETRIFSTKARWQISSGVTTQHLLSVISVANTLMSMNKASFLNSAGSRQSRSKNKPVGPHQLLLDKAYDSSEASEDESDNAMLQQSQIKQGWSLLAALHCVLLPELVGATHYQPPQLEMLARRWQDRCLEIREAAQALLLAELRRINIDGRKSILDDWAPFLPNYVEPRLSLMSADGPAMKADDDEDDDDDEQMLAGDSPVHKTSNTFESRRKQATAIVMLGVIGAEFGHEIEPSKRKGEEPKKLKKGSAEGFTLTNYSLSRHTSKALTFLLQQPPSRKLPAHTPIRRAAIDLLGRGFTVWEPYLDVSAVLLGLLELCIDGDRLVPSMTFGLPLSPAADACRTARHALSLIATARPPAFIITMAKEVARYNAMAQNAQSQHPPPHNSVLIRSKQEILRVIELLVEKMPNDVSDQLVEAMDVTVHCLDLAQLKAKGLQDLFPAICRFSMVSSCNSTKRIWVGAKNGGLAFYDLKQHSKCQIIQAHNGPVIAVAVSPDGKYLVSHSHADSKIKFWQRSFEFRFYIPLGQDLRYEQLFSEEEVSITHTGSSITHKLRQIRRKLEKLDCCC
ncbi:hypothetical protein ScPMuIL_001166 [Solemya velum]